MAVKSPFKLKKDEVSYWIDIVLAVIFGLFAAGAVWVFDWVVEFSGHFDPEKMHWFWVMIIPAVGGLVVGVVAWFSKMKASGGVVDVIAHIFTRKHIISKPKALLKPALAAVSIISGNPVGSEAPVVMLGAQIASFSSRIFKLPRARKRMLIACGAAAGIASAFLSPLAAIAFALEIILMEFSMYEFGMLALSTGSAYITAKLLGVHSILHIPLMPTLEWTQLWLFVLLGLVCAVIALFWTRLMNKLEHFAEKHPSSRFWGPVSAGLIAGFIAIFIPEIWGPGYHQMSAMFVTKLPLFVALGIVLAKLIGTSFVLGLSGAGGDLAPGMFIGAGIGVAIGVFYPPALPVLVLAGICAQLAATMHAPLFGILLSIELSRQVNEVLPVIVAISIASLLTLRIMPRSIYAEKAHKHGILSDKAQFQDPMETAVSEIMTTHLITIPSLARVKQVIETMHKHNLSALPVMERNILRGIVTLHDLRKRVAPGELDKRVDHITTKNPITCPPATTIKSAWELLKEHQIGRLLVVSDADNKKLLGIVTKKDLLEAATRRYSKLND